MDESQVRAILEEANASLKDELVSLVNKSISGYASRATKELDKKFESFKPTEPSEGDSNSDSNSEPQSLETKRLAAELKTLKDELQAKEDAAIKLERENVLGSAINSVEAVNKSALTKILRSELDLVKEDGKWFVNSGETPMTVDEAVKGYLSSDEGKSFLPAPKSSGSGTTETNPKNSSVSSGGSPSIDEIAAGLMNR